MTKAKKKFPKFITIMGRKVIIKQVPELKNEAGEDLAGECDYNKKTILINKDQTHEEKCDTLVHEATHFFLELTGISQKIDENTSEVYCQLIAALFHDLKNDI
jgi:Zn-dependent peptidase ImmA (M78 family)